MAWYNKGVSLENLGKYQEAIACYDIALEINPSDAEAWGGKGLQKINLIEHKKQ
jgi:tetratricopeptide (TPR) repeat protein